eukprot:173504_1
MSQKARFGLKAPRASLLTISATKEPTSGTKRKVSSSSSTSISRRPGAISKKARTNENSRQNPSERSKSVSGRKGRFAKQPVRIDAGRSRSNTSRVSVNRNAARPPRAPISRASNRSRAKPATAPKRAPPPQQVVDDSEEMEELQSKMAQMEEVNLNLTTDLERERGSHSFQDKLLSQKDELLSQKNEQIKNFREMLKGKDDEIEGTAQSLRSVQAANERLVQEKENQTRGFDHKKRLLDDSLEQQKNRFEQNEKSLKSLMNQEKLQSEERERSLNDMITKITRRSNEITIQKSQLEADLSSANMCISDLKALNSRKMDEIELKHRMEIQSKDVRLELLEQQISSLKGKCEGLSGQIRQQISEIAALSITKDTLEAKLRTNSAQLDSTKQLLESSEAESARRATVITAREEDIVGLRERVAELEAKSRVDEQKRKRLHNAVLELKGNIRVFCRVRPSKGELSSEGEPTPMDEGQGEGGDHQCFEYIPDTDDRGICVVGPSAKSLSGADKTGKRMNFEFDRVFNPREIQSDVFEELSQLVQSAIDGYKVCIFAYGQTGSGKTYTMEGPDDCTDDTRGMIPRSVHKIFECIEQLKERGWQYTCTVMFLEIYNERLRDLLNEKSVRDPSESVKYEIKHGKNHETTVLGLQYVTVTSPRQVTPLLARANATRAVGKTDCNERSSRSHSVFQMKITGKNETTGQSTSGVLNLIDLAGSERLKHSNSTGDRLKEAQAINKSLSSLGDVICALNNRDKHVPYRNSKLTYLLQNCFGGDSKTLMFVNLSPECDSLQESICSLRFASKVNACQIGVARRNVKI